MTSKASGLPTKERNCLSPLIERHTVAIRALAREYGVARLEVFGSVCTPEWDPERSDVDFLVEYPPNYNFGPWASRLFALENALADLLDRDVDLVMISALRRDRFRREADKTRTPIYVSAEVVDIT